MEIHSNISAPLLISSVSGSDHMYVTATGSAAASTSTLSSPSASLSSATSNPPLPTNPVVRGRSKVWNEFTVTEDGRKVVCRLCGDCLAYSHSHSTSSMLKHLKRKHNLDLYPSIEEDFGGANVTNFDKASGGSNFSNTRSRLKSRRQNISKDAEEIDKSIQHGTLLFKDPCVRMKWTDHPDTMLQSFSSLYTDESYTDVTLVAEGNFFKAHRCILSSASEFFDETFKMTPSGQHPLIFLKDVKSLHLRILLDFIYKGEVSIPQVAIPALVKIGKDLRVRGLSDFIWNEQLVTQNATFQDATPIHTSNNPTDNRVWTTQQILQPPAQLAETHIAPQTSTALSSPELSSQVPRLMSPPRTVLHPIQQVLTRPPPRMTPIPPSKSQLPPLSSGPPPPKTYSRLVNIRAAPNTSLASSCLSPGLPALKRIRIVTSADPGQSVNSQMVTVGATPQNTAAETVLMVTNEGEAMLSTTQGGVTVLAPTSSTTLSSMSTVPKDAGLIASTATQSCVESFQCNQVETQPVTILTATPDEPQTLGEEMDEVVYSITEISGDQHEVMMSGDQDTIIVCANDDQVEAEEAEKKPFLNG